MLPAFLAALGCLPLDAQTAATEVVGNNQPSVVKHDAAPPVSAGLAMTPPMGWNTWNKFGCNISETTIRSAADSMASSGMLGAGYRYLVIDDCWHGTRDARFFVPSRSSLSLISFSFFSISSA